MERKVRRVPKSARYARTELANTAITCSGTSSRSTRAHRVSVRTVPSQEKVVARPQKCCANFSRTEQLRKDERGQLFTIEQTLVRSIFMIVL